MPYYNYECQRCNAKLRVKQGIKDKPLTVCQRCRDNTLVRTVPKNVGAIYKGSGFHGTDY